MRVASEFVSSVQRPAESLSVGNAGTVQDLGYEAGTARGEFSLVQRHSVGPAVPAAYSHTRREMPELGERSVEPATHSTEIPTTVSGAGTLQQQHGRLSDSNSGNVSTVQEFVYETDATVGSELLQPGQRSPQPPSQHGPPLTSPTPPTRLPVSSELRPPAQRVHANRPDWRARVGRAASACCQHSRLHSREASPLALLRRRRHSSPRLQQMFSLTS